MLIRLGNANGNYDILVNPEDISQVHKDEENGHTCYTYCNCNPPTVVTMRNGDIHTVDESMNTIEARVNRAIKES